MKRYKKVYRLKKNVKKVLCILFLYMLFALIITSTIYFASERNKKIDCGSMILISHNAGDR